MLLYTWMDGRIEHCTNINLLRTSKVNEEGILLPVQCLIHDTCVHGILSTIVLFDIIF